MGHAGTFDMLAVVIEANGGQIELASDGRNGSSFRVLLPDA